MAVELHKNGRTFPVHNPSTGEVIVNVPDMEILRVQMYGRPSKNISLGRVTSEY